MGKIRDLFTANDMTVGTPWKSIARFAFPMLIGNFAQQLYNTVDAVVVGRSKWGYTALASVGNALPILNLLLALFVGIATGAGILVAQFFEPNRRPVGDSLPSLSTTIKTASCQGGLFCLLSSCF